jgi:hypothetical protein
MKTTTKSTGIKVNTSVKAGGLPYVNHNQTGLKVRSGIRGGSSIVFRNHNARMFSVA